jgi:hypothetical protein
MSKPRSTRTTKPTIKPIPVPKPVVQVGQGKHRMAVMSQSLGPGDPEYKDMKNKQRHCLDGCIKRAEKAAKNKPKINYDKMFG